MNKFYFFALIALFSLVSARAFACEGGACPGPIEPVAFTNDNGGSDDSDDNEPAQAAAETLKGKEKYPLTSCEKGDDSPNCAGLLRH